MHSFSKLVLLYMALLSYGSVAETLVLDKVSELEFHQKTRALLVKAHQSIGNELVFLDIPLGRSYQEIQKGVLSGFVCRVDNLHEKHPNIVKVSEPIGEFKVILVIDTQQCSQWNAVEELDHIASVQGFVALQDYLDTEEKSASNITYLANREKVFEMLNRKRVDGIIVSDVLVPEALLNAHPDWKVVTLKTQSLFHYLHVDYAHMANSLAAQLRSLQLEH